MLKASAPKKTRLPRNVDDEEEGDYDEEEEEEEDDTEAVGDLYYHMQIEEAHVSCFAFSNMFLHLLLRTPSAIRLVSIHVKQPLRPASSDSPLKEKYRIRPCGCVPSHFLSSYSLSLTSSLFLPLCKQLKAIEARANAKPSRNPIVRLFQLFPILEVRCCCCCYCAVVAAVLRHCCVSVLAYLLI